MKINVKAKFPLMENVALVEMAMIKRHWNKSALSKESGVSSAVITRFFQDGKISSENLFKILNTLNLLNKDSDIQTSVRCSLSPQYQNICDMIREIFYSTDTQIHAAHHTNLVAFKNSAMKDQKINNLEKKVDYLMELYDPKIKSGI